MQDMTSVYGLFRAVYAASWDRFLVFHLSNRLAVEEVIIKDKI